MGSSVAQVVAGVPARMLLQVLLVVVLRRPEGSRRHDLGHDLSLPLPGLLDPLPRALRRLPLLLLHPPEAPARERRGLALGGTAVGPLEEPPIPPVALSLELIGGNEAERRGIHAVPFSGRGRAVVEDVAEVGVAVLRTHLG